MNCLSYRVVISISFYVCAILSCGISRNICGFFIVADLHRITENLCFYVRGPFLPLIGQLLHREPKVRVTIQPRQNVAKRLFKRKLWCVERPVANRGRTDGLRRFAHVKAWEVVLQPLKRRPMSFLISALDTPTIRERVYLNAWGGTWFESETVTKLKAFSDWIRRRTSPSSCLGDRTEG